MPTIIDELIIKLGLDASGYKRGADQAKGDLRKTSEEAKKRAKEIEDAGKRASAFFTKLRNEALGLFAALAVGRGLTQFVQNTIGAEAAVGRLAKNIGMTTESLTAWQNAAKRFGGSAEATAASFQGLRQQFEQFALTSQSSVLPFFRALGVEVTGLGDKVRPLDDILVDLSKKFQTMEPSRAQAWGANLGLDQGTVNLLMQGPVVVARTLEEMKRLGVITQKDAESGQALSNSVLGIQQAVERLGRAILTAVSGPIQDMLTAMEKWLEVNRKWIEEDITRNIEEFVKYLRSIDWNELGRNIKEFGAGVNQVVEALGGWEKVSIAIFSMWAVGKLSAITLGAVALARAVGAIGVSLSSQPVVAALVAWNTYMTLMQRFKKPTSQEELDEQMRSMPPNSPLWRDIPHDQQLRYPNSPASRGGADDSWAKKNMPWLFPATPNAMADQQMNPYQTGFLQALSQPESRGSYTIRNGGSHITDFSAHPGPGFGPGGTSSAAGRYQFTHGTWQEVAKELGLTDFSPQSQDRAAWHLAAREYRAKTGRDLMADLQAGGHEDQIAEALSGRWSSLPGGKHPQLTKQQWKDSLKARTQGALTPPKPAAGGAAPPLGTPPPIAVPPPSGSNLLNPASMSSSGGVQSETNINGPITVNTAATDAEGIARDLGAALRRTSFVSQANTGLA